MKKIALLSTVFVALALCSFSTEASTPSPAPAPILTCNSITGWWSGSLSNGITPFQITINDAGGDPEDDADINYNDDQGGSDGASVLGSCTASGNTISMSLHSNYQPISFTVTMIDAIHATVSGQFTDVGGGVIQASGTISRT